MFPPTQVYPTSSPTPPEHGTVVVYDLRDPEAWDAALLARKAWDRRYSRLEVLDNDHVAITFLPGAARRRAG